MPYKYDWYIKEQVIFLEVWGEQTIEELQASNLEMISYLDASDRQLVHVIINDQKLESVPPSILKMRQTLTYGTHPRLGWVVMVGVKPYSMTEFLLVTLAKLFRARYIRMRTLDEALDHLRKVDTKIDWEAVSHDVGQDSQT